MNSFSLIHLANLFQVPLSLCLLSLLFYFVLLGSLASHKLVAPSVLLPGAKRHESPVVEVAKNWCWLPKLNALELTTANRKGDGKIHYQNTQTWNSSRLEDHHFISLQKREVVFCSAQKQVCPSCHRREHGGGARVGLLNRSPALERNWSSREQLDLDLDSTLNCCSRLVFEMVSRLLMEFKSDFNDDRNRDGGCRPSSHSYSVVFVGVAVFPLQHSIRPIGIERFRLQLSDSKLSSRIAIERANFHKAERRGQDLCSRGVGTSLACLL